MAGKQRVSLSKLEDKDGQYLAMCGICLAMLDESTAACAEGHSFCRECIVTWLDKTKKCPTCRADTDITK